MVGSDTAWPRPAMASTPNHSAMTGPNARPTTPVPKRWIANRATMMTRVAGTTTLSKPSSMTFRPSTADSTEMAGVIIPSP